MTFPLQNNRDPAARNSNLCPAKQNASSLDHRERERERALKKVMIKGRAKSTDELSKCL